MNINPSYVIIGSEWEYLGPGTVLIITEEMSLTFAIFKTKIGLFFLYREIVSWIIFLSNDGVIDIFLLFFLGLSGCYVSHIPGFSCSILTR